MKSPFKGFDSIKAGEELKEKTRQRIMARKTAASPVPRKRIVWSAVAACLSIVIVGTGMLAVFGKKGYKMEVDGSYKASTGDTLLDGDDELVGGDGPAGDVDLNGGTDGPVGDIVLPDDPAEKPGGTAGDRKDSTEKPSGTAGKPGAPNASAGLLTAKAWNDNLHFADWRNLISQNGSFFSYRSGWRIALENRIAVKIRSGQEAVCGAKAVLLDRQGLPLWSGVSDSKGRVYLFYDSAQTPAKITVQYQDIRAEKVLDSTAEEITFDLKQANKATPALDLMFVCDTTGSMRDELSYLQTELEDIIRRVKKDNSNIPVRLSVNFYRDHGDSYVLRPFPFTESIDTALKNLKAQSAAGGGDFEEAVEEALADALYQHQWSETASAKLLFLILDAPPHAAAAQSMKKLLTDAAEKGIRIIPVTGSGIDQNTEFLMRSLGVGTGGTYVALTNDSGVGNGHLDPSVGQTETKKLNDLLVEIINGYLS